MNLMPRLNQTWHQLLSNRPRRSCDKHSHHQLLHRGLPYTPQDKTAAPAVTPPSTPARERRRGGGNAGDRLATLARLTSPTAHREDRSRSASGTKERVVAQGRRDPTRSAQSTLSGGGGREEPRGRPAGLHIGL